jgi:hypothetical protein
VFFTSRLEVLESPPKERAKTPRKACTTWFEVDVRSLNCFRFSLSLRQVDNPVRDRLDPSNKPPLAGFWLTTDNVQPCEIYARCGKSIQVSVRFPLHANAHDQRGPRVPLPQFDNLRFEFEPRSDEETGDKLRHVLPIADNRLNEFILQTQECERPTV